MISYSYSAIQDVRLDTVHTSISRTNNNFYCRRLRNYTPFKTNKCMTPAKRTKRQNCRLQHASSAMQMLSKTTKASSNDCATLTLSSKNEQKMKPWLNL